MLVKDLPFYNEKLDLSKMVKSINIKYLDKNEKCKIKMVKARNNVKNYIIKLKDVKLAFNTIYDRIVYPEDIVSGYVFLKSKNDVENQLKNTNLKIFESEKNVDNFLKNGKLVYIANQKYVFKVNYYSGEFTLVDKYTEILNRFNRIYDRNIYNLNYTYSRNNLNPIKTNVIKFFCLEENRNKFIIFIRNMKKNIKLRYDISEHFELSKCKSFFYTDSIKNIKDFIFMFKLQNSYMNNKIFILKLDNDFITCERLKL